MGVGSSRMSGVNNVALWTGKKASPYVPFIIFNYLLVQMVFRLFS
jgi:aconitate hydratase 2/2-methylisocitrate dehydratase